MERSISSMLPDESLLTFSHEKYIWRFYKDPEGNLLTSKYDPLVQIWSEEEVLVPGFKEEYSIALDDGKKIHLIAEDLDNKLNYLHWDGTEWSEITRLLTYNQNPITNLMLAALHGLVHLVYLSQGKDSDDQVTVHQYFDGQIWSAPRLLNTVGTPCGKAVLQINGDGKHHLISQETNKGKHKLKHYIFDPQKNQWQYYQYCLDITSKSASGGFEPCMISDRNNNLHLVWLSSDGTNFRVQYSRYLTSSRSVRGWTKTKTISLPNSNAYSPILIIVENNLLALWQQIDGIYISVSKDQGNSWSKPEKEGQLQDFMTKSLGAPKLPLPYEEMEDSTNDLPIVQQPNALEAKSLQPADSDKRLNSLSFAMEDNRLTSEQIASTVKKQQEQMNYTNNRLERVYQYSSRLEKQINNNHELLCTMQQEIEQIRSEYAQKNEQLKSMQQQLNELKAELEEKKKTAEVCRAS